MSDIGECQRTGSCAVDVREAVFRREAGGHQHLSGVAEHIRIGRESRHGPPDELGGFGICQVEPLCSSDTLSRRRFSAMALDGLSVLNPGKLLCRGTNRR